MLRVPLPTDRPVVVLEQPKLCGKAVEKPIIKPVENTTEPVSQDNEKKTKKEKQTKKPKDKANGNPPAAAVVDISRLNMRIGKIVEVKIHPDADGLYVETVDFGTETRTICSKLVKNVPIEQVSISLSLLIWFRFFKHGHNFRCKIELPYL